MSNQKFQLAIISLGVISRHLGHFAWSSLHVFAQLGLRQEEGGPPFEEGPSSWGGLIPVLLFFFEN